MTKILQHSNQINFQIVIICFQLLQHTATNTPQHDKECKKEHFCKDA